MRMMAMAFPFENLDFGRLWWMTEGTSILHQVQALNDICAFLWQRICQNQVLYLLRVQYVLSFLAQERASADLLVPHWETKSSRGVSADGRRSALSCSLTSTRCGRRDFTHHLKTHFFRTHNLGRIWIQFWNKPACWCSVVTSVSCAIEHMGWIQWLRDNSEACCGSGGVLPQWQSDRPKSQRL